MHGCLNQDYYWVLFIYVTHIVDLHRLLFVEVQHRVIENNVEN